MLSGDEYRSRKAMKVKGTLGFLRAWAQVSALGLAMLPEEQGSMRAFAQSGFDINGLHTKTLKRHWITTEKAHNKQNRITKENKSRGDSWHLKETFFSSLSYADIVKETSGFLDYKENILSPYSFQDALSAISIDNNCFLKTTLFDKSCLDSLVQRNQNFLVGTYKLNKVKNR